MAHTPHSIVVICSAADRAGVLAVGEAMGVSAGIDVPLSESGRGPATHYGARSWVTPVFAEIMAGTITPTIPGVTAEQIKSALAGVIADTVENAVTKQGFSARQHFLNVCAQLNLHRIEADL